MIVKNLSEKQLRDALELTNKTPLLQGNLEFLKLEKLGLKKEKYRVRLKTKDYSKPGWKTGFTGRKTPHACFHSHGLFFLACAKINPDVKIFAGNSKIKPYIWLDRNIGGLINSVFHSDSCICKDDDNYSLFIESVRLLLPENEKLEVWRDYTGYFDLSLQKRKPVKHLTIEKKSIFEE